MLGKGGGSSLERGEEKGKGRVVRGGKGKEVRKILEEEEIYK